MRTGISCTLVCCACVLLFWGALPGCGSEESDGPTGPGGELDTDFLRAVLANEIGGIRNAFALPGGPPGCLEIAPVPLLDSDQDGVPDVAVFTYDQAGCAVSGGDFALTTWGTIETLDPGEPFGYTARIVALAHRETSGSPSRTVTRTAAGTRTVGGSPMRVELSTSFSVHLEADDGSSSEVDAAWTAVFTPELGNSVSLGLGVSYPKGSIEVEGTLEWVQGGSTYEFDLRTVAPLEIDPACSSPFAIGGELEAALVSGGLRGSLLMFCTGCGGQIEFEWEAAP